MAEVSIKISGAFLNDPDIRPLVTASIKAGAVYIKGKMAEYPPASHRPQPFKTDKQRRFFFAALKDGRIDVPYRRGQSPGSEDLAGKWTQARPDIRDDGLTAVVGVNVQYARFVQKEGEQSAYHKGTGWKTDEQVVKKEQRTTVKAIEAEIAKGIARMNR